MEGNPRYDYWARICRRHAALTLNPRTRHALEEMAAEFRAKADGEDSKAVPELCSSGAAAVMHGHSSRWVESATLTGSVAECQATCARLAESKNRIDRARRHIERQERIVAELDRKGHETKQAVRLLQIFRRLQAQQVAYCNRIMGNLPQGSS